VFALYGSLTDGSGYDRLRSHYAEPERESFVDLVYEVNSGIYRVRRTPHYERPKQRGEGTTVKQSTARLWRLSNPDDRTGEIIATKVEEASAEIRRTIGLTPEQFTQTVVLPQGQFAAFLKADNEQRRVLLQRIFGTQLYEDLAAELKSRRARAEAEQQELAGELRFAAATLVGAANLDGEEGAALVGAAQEIPDQAGADQLLKLVGSVRSAMAVLAERAGADLAAAKDASLKSVAAAQAAQAAAELAATRQVLTERLAQLVADQPRRKEQEQRLDAARRAGPVMAVLDSALRAADALTEAQALAESLGLAADQIDEAAAQTVREQAQANLHSAQERLDAAKSLELAAAAESVRVRELSEARAAAEQAQEAVAEATKAVDREASEGPPARVEAERLEKLAAAVDQHVGAVSALKLAEDARDRAKQAYEASQQTELRLRNSRLADMAGEMAAGLADGERCPVCGSLEHPAPAQLSPDHITREQVDQAEADRAAAGSAYEASLDLVKQAAATVARLEGLGGSSDRAEVAARLETARKLIASLGSAEELRSALDQAKKVLTAAQQRLGLAETAAQAAHDQVVEAQSRAGGIGAEAAAQALSVAKEGADLARQRLEATQNVIQAANLAESSAASAERALAQAAFANADAARAVRMTESEIAQTQEELTQLAGEETSIRARLAEPEFAQAKGEPQALVQASKDAATAANQAQAAAAAAAEVATLAEKTAKDTERAASQVGVITGELIDIRRSSAALARVANLANAGSANLRDVDLATFVLIKRFEEVIDAANDRLGPMSDGQYLLERSDKKEATRKHRTGLALRVMDNQTEQPRDPRTLSGGETFYVSLALALGLADVVTAEAGGISLETLFVDEGFGSLSEETLEFVLAQLDRIRAGGRAVGVVSHVEALKQAIPDRIEVRPRREGGSTLRVRSAS
jgi:exonuclease SbcC